VGKVEAGIRKTIRANPAVISRTWWATTWATARARRRSVRVDAAENIGAMILGSGLALANPGVFTPAQVVGLMLFSSRRPRVPDWWPRSSACCW